MSKAHLFSAVLAVSALLAGPAAAVAAGPTDALSAAPQWLVELEGAPAADGASHTTLAAEHRRFRAKLEDAGVRYRQRFSYTRLFNGVALSATDATAAVIGRLDGVAAVYPVEAIPLDVRVETIEPELTFALTMTGADVAQSRLGYTGRGIHVAMIDSGVDYDHPDLGGCFGPGCRVTNGYDLVGDDYDEEESAPGWQPVPHPDPDPDDCAGHGTHVAGIIGANGAIRGVAPDVTFAAYRVFGCSGATSTDVMLAAMERVYRDGADVLNMSIGETRRGWPEAPVAQAASRLVRDGIVVVAAAGNDHLDGLFGAGAPGVGEGVIDTASVENLKQYRSAVAISPDNRPVVYQAGNGSAPLPAAGTEPIARTGTITTPDDACAPLPSGSLEGKLALVRRGTCPFADKGNTVAAAGATGMVVYNNAGAAIGSPNVTGVPIPVIYISQDDGELINARLDAGPVSLTWGFTAAVPNPTAGLASVFSSEGLAADLSLKPDIAAPGGSIRSTWPLEGGRYAVLSGTSMASPHVAGAAALYLQAHPHTRAQDVRDALQNSADPVPATSGGNLEPVVRQGAGLVDIDDAILATSRIAPGKLSLGDDGSATSQSLTISNRLGKAVTYALSNADAQVVVGRDITVERSVGPATTVAFTVGSHAAATVTVPPGGRARLEVRVTPDPALSEGALYGGYLVFTPDDGSPPLRVPYAGYKGDYQDVPAMTPTSRGYPWLARQTGVTLDGLGRIRRVYAKQDAGAVFTLAPRVFGPRTGADVPVALVHLNNFARRIRMDVVTPGSPYSLGEAFRQDYVPRDAVENLLAQPWSLATSLAFDGTVRRGDGRVPLPDGEYQLVVTVERALADADTPVETWTSPAFRIDRSG
jgi:minor extracellular serine protease Vpr